MERSEPGVLMHQTPAGHMGSGGLAKSSELGNKPRRGLVQRGARRLPGTPLVWLRSGRRR